MTYALKPGQFKKAFCAFTLLLLATLALPATAQSLPSSEIDALKTELVVAGDVYNDLGAKMQCYVDEDAALQDRNLELQQKAGDLHRQEQQVSAELAKTQSEADGYRREYDQARQDMRALSKKMRQIEAQIRVRQADLDHCKSQWWTPNFLCDWAGEIVGLNSDLRKLTAEKKAIDIKARSLQQHLSATETRLKQAQQKYQRAHNASAQTKREIEITEAEIKVVKASLSEIRSVKQDYAIEFRNFQDAFSEFEGLDPASDRRSVVRRLRNAADNLNDLLLKARTLLDNNGLQLPSGKRICAS